jgi:uncharacterized protein YidB (DUF937 family)
MSLNNLLGGVLNAVAGQGGQQNPLLQMATALLQDNGGLNGLLDKLQQGGLAEAAASWVGTGQNQAVDAGQLSTALGHEAISAIAARFGVNPAQAGAGLADLLPRVIDGLTPDGQVPANAQGDVLGALVGQLAGKLFR